MKRYQIILILLVVTGVLTILYARFIGITGLKVIEKSKNGWW